MNIKVKHIINEMKEMLSLLEGEVRELEAVESNGLIRFKKRTSHPDMETEYEKCDNRLRFMFNSYICAVYRKYNYKPMICVIERTQKEQDLIYGKNPKYQAGKWMSTHQTTPCRAIDFRDYDMPQEVIDFTMKYFEQVIYSTPDKKTLLRHNVGFGSHWHVQCGWTEILEIKKIYIPLHFLP